MILVTTNDVEGYKVKEVKGYVKGSTVRAKNIGKDIVLSYAPRVISVNWQKF